MQRKKNKIENASLDHIECVSLIAHFTRLSNVYTQYQTAACLLSDNFNFFCSIKYNVENAESKNAILKIMLEIVIFELMQENKTHAFMRLHISMTNYKSVFGIRFFFLNAIISCILLNCAHSSYWVDAIGSLLLKWYRETGKKAFERCVSIHSSIQIIGLLLLWLCEHWLQIDFIRKSVCA